MIQEKAQTFLRRFPRVFLTSIMREFKFISNCEVIWPSKLTSGIYDFGRSSVTVYFPMRLNMNLAKNDFVNLGFKIGKDSDVIYTECRVIRSETRLLVVEPLRLSKAQSNDIARYFTEDVIAENTHPIPKKYFAPEQTFTFWFHGPRDTNLYIWRLEKGIQRVILELENNIYEWNKKGFFVGPSRDTLSYATEDYAYYASTLAPLRPVEAKSDEALKCRYFVSTLTSTHPVIKEVSKQIEA